jgi:hypothetical protein
MEEVEREGRQRIEKEGGKKDFACFMYCLYKKKKKKRGKENKKKINKIEVLSHRRQTNIAVFSSAKLR